MLYILYIVYKIYNICSINNNDIHILLNIVYIIFKYFFYYVLIVIDNLNISIHCNILYSGTKLQYTNYINCLLYI